MTPRNEELLRKWIDGDILESEAGELLAELDRDREFLREATRQYRIHRLIGAQRDLDAFGQQVARSVATLRDQAGARHLADRIVARVHRDAHGEEKARGAAPVKRPSLRLKTVGRIGGAGKSRRLKPVRPAWRRWLPVAACLAVVVGAALFHDRLAQPKAEAIAALLAADAGVTVTPRGGRAEPARAGMPVRVGDVVKTPAGGQATLQYEAGGRREATTVVLLAETDVQFSQERGGKRVFLPRGTIECSVAKQPEGKPMVLETPVAEATVVGTQFRLQMKDSVARLEIAEGRVRLARKADGDAVEVAMGQMAEVGEGIELAARPLARSAPIQTPGAARQAWTWRFDRKEKAAGFRVRQGQWHFEPGVDGSGAMQTDSGAFEAEILAEMRLPVRAEMKVKVLQSETTAGIISLDVDRLYVFNNFGTMVAPATTEDVTGIWLGLEPTMARASAGKRDIKTIYVTPNYADFWSAGKRVRFGGWRMAGPAHQVSVLRGMAPARLGLVFRGKVQIEELTIREITPEDLPDARLFADVIARCRSSSSEVHRVVAAPEISSSNPAEPVQIHVYDVH